MTRTMYDGVTATRLPLGAQMVAGYVDGRYAWSAADWARFSAATIRVRIAVFATTDDGHVLDCEPGNCTPAQSVDWVLMRRRAGVDPTVYCNQMDPQVGWPAVRAAFQVRGVPEPHYWVAKYDGVETIPDGAIGKQYADDEASGWDLSVVADYWPGVDPAPVSIPKEYEMILHNITGSPEVWALSGSLYWHVSDPASLNSYKAAGVPAATISAAEHAGILAAVAKLGAALTLDAAAASAIGAAIKFPTKLMLSGSETGTLS